MKICVAGAAGAFGIKHLDAVAAIPGIEVVSVVGHGVTAWLRGDLPTELTSNHLSAELDDRLVSAGVTIVNLLVGGAALALVGRIRDNTWRYGVWLLAALNLLPGAGYFLFSGIIGVGDWSAVIDGLQADVAKAQSAAEVARLNLETKAIERDIRALDLRIAAAKAGGGERVMSGSEP